MTDEASGNTVELTPEQLARERSLKIGILLDLAMIATHFTVSLVSGSFTLLAEAIRGGSMVMIEILSWVTLRRIHRHRLTMLEFGVGKVEQFIAFGIGCLMLASGGWIAVGALSIIAGEREVGTPLGLAFAAIINVINVMLNFRVWDAVRRAAAGDRSVLMEAQLSSRTVKLYSSVIVQIAMTIAAVCLDSVIAAWADVAGSLFVMMVIFRNALQLIRSSLPDLLDRTTDHRNHAVIDEVVAAHAASYRNIERLRSRQSGATIFIEVALAFDQALTVAEVDRRVSLLRGDLLSQISGADVAVLVVAAKD